MKRLVVGGAVLALGIAGMSAGSAAPAQYKVTGGGQIIVDTEADPAKGPGETIAFNAHSTGADDAARGQLQYNSHTGVKFHGQVECLVVDGNRATLAGTVTRGDNNGADTFQVDVLDNGQGASDDDLILLTSPDDVDCGPENPTEQLGRGNVTIHKGKG